MRVKHRVMYLIHILKRSLGLFCEEPNVGGARVKAGGTVARSQLYSERDDQGLGLGGSSGQIQG